ncbi:hypothetical protein T440DRAFT_210048 [Plenodomus tracheiphilus IPT5]|uniref:Secreted protein n=1 Tax=Plenodomus tracheiphilus IPT5 TaxID=1408161 RepID=A0A6A7BIY6_9PLEO|nr:hypothetical protein T440DRAFT_210048 [Plenodomus tracheiphilus IPT5]
MLHCTLYLVLHVDVVAAVVVRIHNVKSCTHHRTSVRPSRDCSTANMYQVTLGNSVPRPDRHVEPPLLQRRSPARPVLQQPITWARPPSE